MNTIADCPFCEGPALAGFTCKGKKVEHSVFCFNVECDAEGPKADSAEQAIYLWNRAKR